MSPSFRCEQCGSNLEYSPGTLCLKCVSCGHENIITENNVTVQEEDFHKANQLLDSHSLNGNGQAKEVSLLVCLSCGAETEIKKDITATKCPFCATPYVLSKAIEKSLLRPKYLLPFKIDRKQAIANYREWIHKLWFAPSALKHIARLGEIFGVYIPFWTYDSLTRTSYVGERGIYYYESQTYTENGQTKTRQVRRTRWYAVSGTVVHQFDDILIPASHSVSQKNARALEPWDLSLLSGFQEAFLSGFQAESYQINLKEGFQIATKIMNDEIQILIRKDIGGDEQRIFSANTEYDRVTYKHLLLPIWISSFKFQNKVYQILVNARTGEVQGDRPWSVVKIICAIAGALGTIWMLFIFYEISVYHQNYYGAKALADMLWALSR